MSYGIATFSANGTLSLHSDYSKLVFFKKVISAATTDMLWKTGSGWTDYTKNLASSVPTVLGYTSSYEIDLGQDISYICPFYKPSFYGQKVAPMDVYKVEGTNLWRFVVLHEGSQPPSIYIFVTMKELAVAPSNDYGLEVTDEDGNLILSESYRPLSIKGIVTAEFPDIEEPSNPSSVMFTERDYQAEKIVTETPLTGDSMFSFYSTAVWGSVSIKVTPKKKRKCYALFCKTKTWNELTYWFDIQRASIKVKSGSTLEAGYLGYTGGKYWKKGPSDTSYSFSILGWEIVSLDDILKVITEFGDFLTAGLLNLDDIFDFSGPSIPKMSVPMPLTTRYPTSIIIANSSDYN